ncbi:MAG: hypothetical protein ACLFRB_05860 [Thiohalorhabdus sp.]|uniref:hypothetical protein n=1 Tax=Thiohalorhabdus sp. TaxID=3094134 RepID=UPI003980A132
MRAALEARAGDSMQGEGAPPFRVIQPLIDQTLAVEAGLPSLAEERGSPGFQPRLLRGRRCPRPVLSSSLTWDGPTPVPVRMHPQDLSALPAMRRVKVHIPRSAVPWSWVTIGSLAFVIVAFW